MALSTTELQTNLETYTKRTPAPGTAGPATGFVFYVGSTVTGATDAAAPFGTTPAQPYATIDFAVGNCTANNGDIIYVMPGHNEAITAATSLVVDVAGIQIIGLGWGNSRPILDFDNTAGTIEMDAADCRLSNLVINASVSVITVAINVDAHRITLDNLEFTFEETGDDFLTCIDVDAFDYCTIKDCVFNTELGATAGTQCIRLDDSHYDVIQDNRFVGNWTAAPIINLGALCQGLLIKDNVIYNEDTTVYGGIDFGALSSTGIVMRNYVTSLYATTLTKLNRTGDMCYMQNFWTNAVSEAVPYVSTGVPATTSV